MCRSPGGETYVGILLLCANILIVMEESDFYCVYGQISNAAQVKALRDRFTFSSLSQNNTVHAGSREQEE